MITKVWFEEMTNMDEKKFEELKERWAPAVKEKLAEQKDASIVVPITNASNEQWKNGGDCTKCRRESYCKTLCTARKRKERKDGKTR